MNNESLIKYLINESEEEYQKFIARLTPSISPNHILGVRVPKIRKIAKELSKDEYAKQFIDELPHHYYEEYLLHVFLFKYITKDIDVLLSYINDFLPYVNNWAVCDTMDVALLEKHKDKVYIEINKWLNSQHTYTVRFGIVIILRFFLKDNYKKELLEWLQRIETEEYYINIALAWCYSTALIDHYEDVLPILQSRKLSKWVHNKTIQKANESYRITLEHKEYLKTLRVK